MGEEKLLPCEVHCQMLPRQEERQVPRMHVLHAPHLLIKILVVYLEPSFGESGREEIVVGRR